MPKRKRNFAYDDQEPPAKRARIYDTDSWKYGAKLPVPNQTENGRIRQLEERVHKLERIINWQLQMEKELNSDNYDAVKHIYM